MKSEPQVRIRPFSQAGETWRRLLSTAANPTLYHSEAWIELLSRAYKFPLSLVTVDRGAETSAACVLARSHNPFVRRFVSLPFSDCCPPLATDDGAASDLLDVLAAHASPREVYEIRGIASQNPWQSVECYTQWNLALDRPLKSIEQGLALNFRRNLRQASREPISIEHDSAIENVRRFYSLQLQNRRRLGLPPQPWSFFKLAREIFAPRKEFDVWLARERGEDVAGAVFLRSRDVVSFKWGARRPDRRSKANHLLLWRAIEHFSTNCRSLDLGRADIRNHGLSRFKAEIGAKPDPLPYAFYPRRPAQISAEVLTGPGKAMARMWARMPLVATRLAASAVYRFLG